MNFNEWVNSRKWHTMDIYNEEICQGAVACRFDRKSIMTLGNRKTKYLKYAHVKNKELHGFYSDRLHLWYKNDEITAARKKFDVGHGDYWPEVEFEKLSGFIGELFQKKIEVVGTIEYRNYMTGYPYWYIIYTEEN